MLNPCINIINRSLERLHQLFSLIPPHHYLLVWELNSAYPAVTPESIQSAYLRIISRRFQDTARGCKFRAQSVCLCELVDALSPRTAIHARLKLY